MKLTDTLYANVQDIWGGYYKHPFIRGIKDGTLEIDKFRFYIIQDYLYLLDYAKVFALGIVKSKDEDVMRECSMQVNDILNGEMEIHNEYVRRLEITQAEFEQAPCSIYNKSYTNYMLTVAYQEGELEILIAILACSWSYLMIGKNINEVKGAAEHEFYGSWIKGYSSKGYEEGNDRILNLVNKVGENITKEQEDKLIEIFRNCSRFEYGFWDMAYGKKL